MVRDIHPVVVYFCMGMQMLTRQEAQWIERVLPDTTSVYMISWSSRKGSIAQSTTEAKYIATSDASKEAVWLKKLVSGLFGHKLETTLFA
jgi:hypothetical protein